LCTCFMGFVNSESVRRVLEKWREEIAFFEEPAFRAARSALLGNSEASTQTRDQELFSMVLHKNALPDVNLLILTPEWLCAQVNHPGGYWVDAFSPNADVKQVKTLTMNPCKAFHSHVFGQGSEPIAYRARDGQFWDWVHSIKFVDPSGAWATRAKLKRRGNTCGGYKVGVGSSAPRGLIAASTRKGDLGRLATR
jgi:hypothetical protein